VGQSCECQTVFSAAVEAASGCVAEASSKSLENCLFILFHVGLQISPSRNEDCCIGQGGGLTALAGGTHYISSRPNSPPSSNCNLITFQRAFPPPASPLPPPLLPLVPRPHSALKQRPATGPLHHSIHSQSYRTQGPSDPVTGQDPGICTAESLHVKARAQSNHAAYAEGKEWASQSSPLPSAQSLAVPAPENQQPHHTRHHLHHLSPSGNNLGPSLQATRLACSSSSASQPPDVARSASALSQQVGVMFCCLRTGARVRNAHDLHMYTRLLTHFYTHALVLVRF